MREVHLEVFYPPTISTKLAPQIKILTLLIALNQAKAACRMFLNSRAQNLYSSELNKLEFKR